MKCAAHLADSIYGVAGFPSLGRRFEQRWDQTLVTGARQDRHAIALREGSQAITVLVGRLSRGNKENPVQTELARCRACRLNMSGVNGIEGAAE
jgi:hypothetical protein